MGAGGSYNIPSDQLAVQMHDVFFLGRVLKTFVSYGFQGVAFFLPGSRAVKRFLDNRKFPGRLCFLVRGRLWFLLENHCFIMLFGGWQ